MLGALGDLVRKEIFGYTSQTELRAGEISKHYGEIMMQQGFCTNTMDIDETNNTLLEPSC